MEIRRIGTQVNNTKIAFMVILLLSLAIRIVFVMTMDREGFYFKDTKHYDNAAVELINNGTFGADYERPPVYPVFLAGVYLISFKNFLLVRLVQCGLGAIISILVFLIGKKIYGNRTAFIAALISAVYPIFIFTSGLLYPTTLITLWLLLLTFFLLEAAEQRPLFNCSVAGLFMGLAILTKPVTLVLFGLLILYFLIQKKIIKSNKLFSVFLFFLCASLVVSTWIARNYYVKGEISIIESNRRLKIFLGGKDSDEDKKSLSFSERLYRIYNQKKSKFLGNFMYEMIHFWSLYPDKVVSSKRENRDIFKKLDKRLQTDNPYVGNFTKYISIISFSPILAFAMIGLITSILRKQKKIFLLFCPILSFWFGYSLIFTQIRYRIPIEPFLIIFASFGLTVFMKWFSRFVTMPLTKRHQKLSIHNTN